jgi:hypothetical protein
MSRIKMKMQISMLRKFISRKKEFNYRYSLYKIKFISKLFKQSFKKKFKNYLL